jgi:type IV secretion system protein VirB10
MSDKSQGQVPPDIQQPVKKIPENDASLSLVKRPTLNKKTLRLLVFATGGIVLFGVFIGLSAPKQKPAKEASQGKPDFSAQAPDALQPTSADYSPYVKAPPVEPGYVSPGKSVASDNTAAPTYGTYNRGTSPDKNSARFVDQQQPPPNSQPSQNEQASSKSPPWPLGVAGISEPSDEEKRRLAALTSSLFFPWTPSNRQQNQNPSSSQSTNGQPAAPGQMTDAQSQALEAAYDTAATKQNMAKEKQQFLDKQQGDYSAYLDNHYITPVDAKHILQAGSFIPITMVTGINSDLPGEIIAQVNEPVFDSLTGQNILIPRGSRLLGTYDNSISFGQNRVLVVWNRLIRTDGVSISLRGMKGTDLQGKSGLHDQVDYHIAQILAVVGAATVFNVGTNVAISALSTSQFLSSLSAAVTAQGNTSSNVTSAATAAAIDYANKIIEQSPTIVIREGTRADCIIDKDMILPPFVDDDDGYDSAPQ